MLGIFLALTASPVKNRHKTRGDLQLAWCVSPKHRRTRTRSQMANDSIAAMASYKSDGSAWTFDEEPVFSADILTPAQFYPAAAVTPCQRLLTAILEDAVHCFQKNCGARSRKRQLLFREAQGWLFDCRPTGFTSCVTICETLGIDPIRLRRYLRRWMVNKKPSLAAQLYDGLFLTLAS